MPTQHAIINLVYAKCVANKSLENSYALTLNMNLSNIK